MIQDKIQDQNRDAARMLLAEIAKVIVDHPEAVEVESIARNEDTLLRLRVAPADVGKLIGKQGRTARSVRAILGALSMKQRSRYALDIVEDIVEETGEETGQETGQETGDETRKDIGDGHSARLTER